MKVPCINCLTYIICKQKCHVTKEEYGTSFVALGCPILEKYVDPRPNERECHRNGRRNKVRRVLDIPKGVPILW